MMAPLIAAPLVAAAGSPETKNPQATKARGLAASLTSVLRAAAARLRQTRPVRPRLATPSATPRPAPSATPRPLPRPTATPPPSDTWVVAPLATPAPAATGPWNLPGKAPHLVAHYMPWFAVQRSADDTHLAWSHWKWNSGGPPHNPLERRDDGLRSIAAVQYPLIGPYNSWSRNVVRYHLRTAHAAGIEAFIVIWYGPGSESDQPVALLLDEAAKIGMRIALCYEEKVNFPDYRHPESRDHVIAGVVTDLRFILDRYGSHPAYLKRNGAPFVAQFNSWGTDELGPKYLTTAEWKKVFARLKRPLVYARQNLDEAYHPTIAGSYLWWTPEPAAIAGYSERAARLVGEKRLGFFMTMVCPGFDDSAVWGWGQGPRIFPRAGLSVLRATFDRAFAGNPELIQIVTWNDFNEGTNIEPTRETGYECLDALETWWGEKTGRAVDLHDNRLPFYDYVKNCTKDERAELPAKPFDAYVARRSLKVDVPDVLAPAANPK